MSERVCDVKGRAALLCFDGSDDAAIAISTAGELLGPRPAVVLTVWQPVRLWEPWDPATILSVPLAKLISQETGLDQLSANIARDKAELGAVLARAAGFDATARVARGEPWEAICEVADELDAEPIVIGSRGLGRARAAMLGSVSSAVVAHAGRAVLVGPAHSVDGPGLARSRK